MSIKESEEILDQLWDITTRPEHIWVQEWQVGDLVVWDDRCTMHRRGEFSSGSRRLLLRTQVKGERPSGPETTTFEKIR